jgi:hypothetical protein
MARSGRFDAKIALLLLFLSFLGPVFARERYVSTSVDGEQVLLKDNRQPSLYTGKFGDCMGSSSINVTRFDAAYYKDNMTVLFHLAGDTALKNESIMSINGALLLFYPMTNCWTVYIGVYAYGESHFDLTFNPCSANIWRYIFSSHVNDSIADR